MITPCYSNWIEKEAANKSVEELHRDFPLYSGGRYDMDASRMQKSDWLDSIKESWEGAQCVLLGLHDKVLQSLPMPSLGSPCSTTLTYINKGHDAPTILFSLYWEFGQVPN
jgi:hypothetical protein